MHFIAQFLNLPNTYLLYVQRNEKTQKDQDDELNDQISRLQSHLDLVADKYACSVFVAYSYIEGNDVYR